MPAVAPEMLGAVVGAGEAPRPEDLEYLLGDVVDTLSRLDSKRGRIQGEIANASRGRRAHHSRRAAPVLPAAEGDFPAAPAPVAYTRKGAGAVRKRLRALAGDAKKEKQRLEALWGELEEALVDAREMVALPPRATA